MKNLLKMAIIISNFVISLAHAGAGADADAVVYPPMDPNKISCGYRSAYHPCGFKSCFDSTPGNVSIWYGKNNLFSVSSNGSLRDELPTHTNCESARLHAILNTDQLQFNSNTNILYPVKGYFKFKNNGYRYLRLPLKNRKEHNMKIFCHEPDSVFLITISTHKDGQFPREYKYNNVFSTKDYASVESRRLKERCTAAQVALETDAPDVFLNLDTGEFSWTNAK